MKEIKTIKVGDLDIKVESINNNDYLCITDFVPKDGNVSSGITIINWLSKIGTINFLGLWEQLNNENFNVMELHNIKDKTKDGERFSISTKQWIEKTNAIGITSKAGRYNSGTYAHVDIALEFASWLSPEFKLYLITEFKRLKKNEAERKHELQDWNIFRDFTKAGYKIQADAINQNIIPILNFSSEKEKGYIFANEADLYNIAVFGMKANEFAKQNPELVKQGKNIRDCASKKALHIVDHLQSANAKMIRDGIIDQEKRFQQLIIQANDEKRCLNLIHKADFFRNDLFNKSPVIKKEKNDKTTEQKIVDNILKEEPELATTENKDFENVIDKTAKRIKKG